MLAMNGSRATRFQFKDRMINYTAKSGCLAIDSEGYVIVHRNFKTITREHCLRHLSAKHSVAKNPQKYSPMLVEMEDKHTLLCPIAAEKEAILSLVDRTTIPNTIKGYYIKVVENTDGTTCGGRHPRGLSLLIRNVYGKA
jgi:hypothetical protein